MHRTVLLCTALAGWLTHSTPVSAQSRRALSLADAIHGAMAQSKSLKINAAEQGVAGARLQQARNNYAPAVSVNLSYVRISDNIRPFTISLPGAENLVLNPQILDQSYNNVQVRQLIWGGGKVRYGIQAAEREAEATRQEATQYRLEAADNAMSMWYNLYLLDASERILRQNVRLLRDRRTDLENLEKQGLVLKNDALKVGLAIANLESSLIDVQSGRAIQNFNMAMALGEPTDTEYVIDSTALNVGPEVEPLTAYLTEAEQNRSELKTLNVRRDAALLGQRIVQSNRLPTLSWGGSYDYNRPNMRVFPLEPAFKGTWNVGVFLSFDVSGQYGNRAKEAESRYGIDKISTGIDQLRDGIQMEVNAQYQSYRQSLDKIRVARQAVEQATENFRVEQNRLNASTTTPADFLDANTQLLQARLNEQSARATAELARWKLLKSVGRIDPSVPARP
ncbi:MAG: TolC family protein [Bacteroidetes bacterium]|nr:TolC family protein [Fibrella sp.]